MMKNITGSRLHLKIVPLIVMLALGMVFAPMSAMAGNGDRGQHKAGQSKNIGNHNDRSNYRNKKHADREPRRNSHGRNLSQQLKHERGTGYGRHYNHGQKKHVRYYPRYDYHYDHRGHGTTHYVVNDYQPRNHYVEYDQLRFMIGLHTNNVDIIFRD